MFCLKFTVSDKEDVQSSVSRISFKEHKSVSHNKAVKKKKHLGKILSHSESTSPLGDDLQSTFFQTLLSVCNLL